MLLYIENNKPFSIKLIGFNDSEARKFSAALDLSEFGLSHVWQVTDAFSADFYLLKDVPSTQFINERLQSRCFNYSPSNSSEKKNAILYDSAQVPLLHDLISLLNETAKKIKYKESLQRNNSTNKAPDSYKPPLFFKKLLDIEKPSIIYLNSDALYINPKRKTFYYSKPVEHLQTCFLSNIDLSIEGISYDQLSKFAKRSGLSAQPLKHLIWFAVFTSSNGHLMVDLSEQDIIHLNEWPYLGVDSPSYIKLATHLKHHAASLAQAAKESGVERELANDFYNASQLAGLIETHPSPTFVPQSEAPEDKWRFLDKIKKRLRH